MKKLLVVGHSLCVPINRAPFREIGRLGDFEVDLLAPATFRGDLTPLRSEPEPKDSGARLITIPAFLSRSPHLFFYSPFALNSVLETGKYDFVFSWQEPYIVSGYQIARACSSFPVPMGFFTDQNLLKNYPPPFAQMEKWVVDCALLWVAAGQGVQETMRRRGYPIERGSIAPHAVDLKRFASPDESKRNEIRARLGLKGTVIAYLGRFVPEKGLDTLMKAIDGLGSHPNISVFLLGGGIMEDKLRAWAATKPFPVVIRLVLHDQIPEILPAAHLLLAPSQTTPKWKEQFGRMLIEAMASGVPVIGSNSGEIPHVIGDAGVIVPEGDEAKWTEAIRRVLEEPSLHAQLRNRGLTRAKDFSATQVGSHLNEMFLNAIGAIQKAKSPGTSGALGHH